MAQDRESWRRRIVSAAGAGVLSASLATGVAFVPGGGAGAAAAARPAARAVPVGGAGPSAGVAAPERVGAPAAGAAVGQARGGTEHSRRMALFRAAAHEFGVPVGLLLAISYNQTRWQRTGGSPSVDGGYGLMDLTVRTFPGAGGRGGPAVRGARTITLAKTHYTLDEAARLLRVPAQALQASERQNIRGAAALLARYERALTGGSLPTSPGGWYAAVAEFSGNTDAASAQSFADDVFSTLRRGASLTTADGQVLDLAPAPGVRPDRAQLSLLGLGSAPPSASSAYVNCPSTLNCRFVSAAYAQDDPSDPGNYGNYDLAGRPSNMLDPAGNTVSMPVRYIVIHDTEGSYNSAIRTFQDPASYVSANYVIRSSDGAVTEMVRPRNVAWGAGDWYINMHAINIENEGYAAQGKTWYTKALYQSCATLVRYLAAKYGVPLNRQHILGHEDVPGPTDYWTAAQHWDPGPFWNWNHFMALVRGVSNSAQQASGGSLLRDSHHLVTIDPTWAYNEPTVTDCSGSRCVTLPKQSANFVYLRTGPGSGYPLIGDRELHPAGGNGTTRDSDWGDKATMGETFVFAGRSGNWTAIWFGGRKAWFYNPSGTRQKARYTGGKVITPRAGLTSISVYGAAYPQSSAYPSAVPVRKVLKLAYTIRAGQAYPTAGAVPTDYYYAATINSSLPDDHTLIIGTRAYYQISFNHRKFFVRAAAVTLKTLS